MSWLPLKASKKEVEQQEAELRALRGKSVKVIDESKEAKEE